MAVFTSLTKDGVRGLLAAFGLSEPLLLEPIASGIENTNYYVDTPEGRWVLTVFERLTREQLPFYLELAEHLGKAGLPVAAPLRTKEGELFSEIAGKPCSIARRLEGESVADVTPAECASMGEVLARMHLAVADFKPFQENLRGPAWWLKTAPLVMPHLDHEAQKLLASEVDYQVNTVFANERFQKIPAGACHCDLFRNNAMIAGHGTDKAHVCGVFDFYFAGCTPFLYDCAVTVNDWCTDYSSPRLALDPAKARAFWDAYIAVRPMQSSERLWWRDMMRTAALRFWLSRLYDYYLPREASLLKPHDPTVYQRILADRLWNVPHLPPPPPVEHLH